MKCRDIMDADPPVLRPGDTVGRALDLLLERRLLAAAVADEAGHYVGMFAKSRLFGLILPSIVAVEDELPRAAHLHDLAFVSEEFSELRERFAELRNHRVGDYADPGAPRVRPDSPLIEAVMLVFRTQTVLPVVEPDTGRLAGMVSIWGILAWLRGGA
jgi:CBS domain-containing protein